MAFVNIRVFSYKKDDILSSFNREHYYLENKKSFVIMKAMLTYCVKIYYIRMCRFKWRLFHEVMNRDFNRDM